MEVSEKKVETSDKNSSINVVIDSSDNQDDFCFVFFKENLPGTKIITVVYDPNYFFCFDVRKYITETNYEILKMYLLTHPIKQSAITFPIANYKKDTILHQMISSHHGDPVDPYQITISKGVILWKFSVKEKHAF